MKKGLTLIEMLTTSIIMVMVILLISSFIIQSGMRNKEILCQTRAHSTLDFVSKYIEENIKKSVNIYTLVNDNQSLFLKNSNNMLYKSFHIDQFGILYENDYTTTPTVRKDLIKYTTAVFATGGFTVNGNFKSVEWDLNIIVDELDYVYETGVFTYFVKCRNRESYNYVY